MSRDSDARVAHVAQFEPAKRKVSGSVVRTVTVRRPSDGYEVSLGTSETHVAEIVARALADLTRDEWTVFIEHTSTEEYVP